MAQTKKERCARELMGYCDALRTIADQYDTTKTAIIENGFTPNGSDPILEADLVNLNLKESDVVEAFGALEDIKDVMNGDPITPSVIKNVLYKLKWWAK